MMRETHWKLRFMSLRLHFQTTACAAVLLIGVQRMLDDA
jgi:hypothetical protein